MSIQRTTRFAIIGVALMFLFSMFSRLIFSHVVDSRFMLTIYNGCWIVVGIAFYGSLLLFFISLAQRQKTSDN